jgi:hypothetical protein
MRGQLSFQLCFCMVFVLLAGCSGSPTEPELRPLPGDLLVAPATASVASGGALQLTASVPSSSQNVTLSPELVWSSSNEQVASVTGDGVVIGRTSGTTDIVAQWNGLRGVSRITVVATSNPQLEPPGTPKGCTRDLMAAAQRGANATTAVPTCQER